MQKLIEFMSVANTKPMDVKEDHIKPHTAHKTAKNKWFACFASPAVEDGKGKDKEQEAATLEKQTNKVSETV
jgi:hypothetical protein